MITGNSATLQCVTVGDREGTFVWKKNSVAFTSKYFRFSINAIPVRCEGFLRFLDLHNISVFFLIRNPLNFLSVQVEYQQSTTLQLSPQSRL